MIEAHHFIFPLDHSKPCYIINSGFDKTNNQGYSSVDKMDPNSIYIPIERLTQKTFKTYEDFILTHDNYYKHYFDLRNKQEAKEDISESNKTGFFTIYDIENNGVASYKLFTTDVVLVHNKELDITEVKLDIDLTDFLSKLTNKENLNIYIWFGNDPTYHFAGQLSSLGYYLYGFELQDCDIVSGCPLTLNCKIKDFSLRINRPTRLP